MKALVKLKKEYGQTELKEVPEPTPGPNQIKVDIKFCGICGTDIKYYHDEHAYYRPPLIYGHEFSGVVTELGAGVQRLKVGDRVIIAPRAGGRGRSLYGQALQPYAGTPARGRGFDAEWGFTTYGGYTKYGVHDQDVALKLPENVDLDSAALSEPLSVCIRGVLDKACIHCTDVVVVSGPGPIGLLTAQLAKAEGGAVVVLGTNADEKRLALAKELGADAVVNVEQEDPQKAVFELAGGSGADVVLECAGVAASVSQCIRLARRWAQYVQIGTSMKIMDIDFAQISYKELNVAGSFGSERLDWERGLKLMSTGKVQTKPLISHRFPLSAWREAFAICEGTQGIKVLLYPDE